MKIFEGFNEGTKDGGFERYCKQLLENLGYTCKLTPESGDDGIDIIAVKDDVYYGIQCKNYDDHNISNEVVLKTIGGLKTYSLNKAMVLTTSNFTNKAKEVAKKCDVELWNGSKIEKLASDFDMVYQEDEIGWEDDSSELFEWNKPVYEKMEEYLEKDNKVMVVIGTGLGKTSTAVEYYKRRWGRALVVANTKAILDGWKKIPNTDTISYAGLYNQYKDLDYSKYTVVICDEIHHSGAATWGAGVKYMIDNGVKVIGLTATMNRMDGIDVANSIFGGNLCIGMDVLDGIKNGIVHNFIYNLMYFNSDEVCQKIKDEYGSELDDHLIGRLDIARNNTPTVKQMVLSQMPKGKRKGIIFVNSKDDIEEGIKLIKDIYPKAECRAIYSGMNKSEEKANREWFENTDEGYICAINKVSEGIHYHGVNTIFMLRRTCSSCVFEQQLGRVVTLTLKENPHAVVFDLVNNSKTVQEFILKTKHKGMFVSGRLEGVRYIECDPDFNDDGAFSKQIIFNNFNKYIDEVLEEIYQKCDHTWTEEEDDIIRKHYPTGGSKEVMKYVNRSRQNINGRAMFLGVRYELMNMWTKEEDDIIRKHYPTGGVEEVMKYVNRSCHSIRRRAGYLDVNSDSVRKWTKEEDDILIKNYKKLGAAKVANMLGRTTRSIKGRAIILNICACPSKHWTKEEDNIIIDNYDKLTIAEIVDMLQGRSIDATRVRANKLGVSLSKTTWTKEEDDMIVNYISNGLSYLCSSLNRTCWEIKSRVRVLRSKGVLQ